MPGITVTTATQSGPNAPIRDSSGQFFLAGLTERGSIVEPILVQGMADVSRVLGNRVAYGTVWDTLKAFFDEGGSQAYVARVVGAAAAVGTVTLTDRAASPAPTLRVDAASPGAWSSGLSVQVMDGAGPDTFRVIVTLGGAVVGDETNLASPAEAVARFGKSVFIKITDLGSATAAPNNNPRVIPATVLTAGTDDRATVTATSYVTALTRFPAGLGDGGVAIPGQGAAAHAGLIAHADANNRIALLAGPRSASVAALSALSAGLDSNAAGLFAPWVIVSDGGLGNRAVSPEGFVAACRARAHDQVGAWRVPAGVLGQASSLLGVDQDFTVAEANSLDSAKVSVVRNIANSVRLYGWRSLSNDVVNWALLKDRDLINRLITEAEKRLEDYVFAPIDNKGQLLASIEGELIGMVEPVRQGGGLFERYDDDGDLIDPGYKVDTGTNVNTTATLAANQVRALLSVRIAPAGQFISLTIVKVGILSGIS